MNRSTSRVREWRPIRPITEGPVLGHNLPSEGVWTGLRPAPATPLSETHRFDVVAADIIGFRRIELELGYAGGERVTDALIETLAEWRPGAPLVRCAADRLAVVVPDPADADPFELAALVERCLKGVPARGLELRAHVGGLRLEVAGAWGPTLVLALLVAEIDRLLTLRLGFPEPLVRRIVLDQAP